MGCGRSALKKSETSVLSGGAPASDLTVEEFLPRGPHRGRTPDRNLQQWGVSRANPTFFKLRKLKEREPVQ